jgi:hypothetical protein
MKSLYPPDDLPSFYVVAPRYVRTSAGIRAMHLICHWLNRIGFRAYMHIDPPWLGTATSPELLTPILTQSIVDLDYQRGLMPIVIMGEVAFRNPLNTGLVVRFVGNYPGLLGGPEKFSPTERVLAYSAEIAKSIGDVFAILYVPAIDTRIYNPPATISERIGACAYLGKYRDVHGGKPFGLPEGTMIFDRDEISGLSPSDIRTLFYKREYFYAFEDTALLTEAALCGCIPVLMLNDHFSLPLGLREIQFAGHAIGPTEAEIERARGTLPQVVEIYKKLIQVFPEQLADVAKRLADEARAMLYTERVVLPKAAPAGLSYNGRMITAAEIARYIKLRGPLAFFSAASQLSKFKKHL